MIKLISFSIILSAILFGLSFNGSNEIKTPVSSLVQNSDTIPKNLEQCFLALDTLLKPDHIQEFKANKEDEITGNYHFGLGMWIRNNWGLWAGSHLAKYFNSMNIWHPDDMSSIILISYHRYLNAKPILFEEQIKFYVDYWEQDNLYKQGKTKEAEATKALMEKYGVKLNRYFKLDSTKITYTFKGEPIYKEVKGNYIIYQSPGFSGPRDNVEKLLSSKEMGKTMYVKEVYGDGRIELVESGQSIFMKKGDTLFYLEEMRSKPQLLFSCRLFTSIMSLHLVKFLRVVFPIFQ